MVKTLSLMIGMLLLTLDGSQTALRGAEPPGAKAVLVSRGKQYLVHVLPPGRPQNEEDGVFSPGRGLDLLYTNLETGEMKVLIKTGTWSVPTRRISFGQNRILGIAADNERLYAVLWTSGRLWDRPPSKSEAFKGGAYHLQVYWLVDGSQIEDRALGGRGMPEEAAKETTERGPLTVEADTVSCYGLTLTFKGKEVVKTAQKE